MGANRGIIWDLTGQRDHRRAGDLFRELGQVDRLSRRMTGSCQYIDVMAPTGAIDPPFAYSYTVYCVCRLCVLGMKPYFTKPRLASVSVSLG
jgi:hypothetical protein